MKCKLLSTKKLFLIVIFIVIVGTGYAIPIMASGLENAGLSVTDQQVRSLIDDVEQVSDIQYMKARNGHLNYGSIELIKVSATRARILATTQAHHVCPEIWMDIYIDQYNREYDEWNQLRYWEYSTTNSQHLTKAMEIIVPSGYYYSIRGYHTCKHGTVLETATTMTDGLYIGTTDKPIL